MTTQDTAREPHPLMDGANHEDDRAESAPATRRRRHRLRTSLILLAAIAVTATGAVAATGALGGDGEPVAAAPSGPPRTAKVQRTTLTRTETVDGTLGYGSATAVRAPAASGSGDPSAQGGQSGQSSGDTGAGIITWLPAAGETIERGEAVYSVDEEKVPLLYGSTPLYRTLAVGSEGKDVELLEKNLSALGYTGFTVDEEFTQGTDDAVRAWQEDLGREETGTVRAGDAVVASGARRVAEVRAPRGSAPAGDVLTWTGTERIITVDLEAKFEDLVEDGENATRATVELPDGTSVDAEVSDIGTAATAVAGGEEGGAGSGGSGAGEATLPVELKVGDQKRLGRYQAAPVEVTLAAESREDVLTVPVNALVALREGGYALETVGSTGIEYLPVDLGMFAGGMVEVSGEGVTDGLVVGVPK